MKKKITSILVIICAFILVMTGCKPGTQISDTSSDLNDSSLSSSSDTDPGSAISEEDPDSSETGSETGESNDSSEEGSDTQESSAPLSSTAGQSSQSSTVSTPVATTTPPANYDVGTAPMPTRSLSNKTLKYYYWAPLDTNPKSWTSLMTKQFGVKFEVTVSSFGVYWDTLATMINSGKSPDIVEMPSWDFYPRPITKNLIQPLDSYMNLNDGLWNETRSTMETFRWKDKTYMAFDQVNINSWLFYNEAMFRNFGVKTPKDYFNEDNWTLETLKEVSDQFVSRNADRSLKTYGFTMQNGNLQAITGVQLVDYNAETGFTFNLKNSRIATLMNWLYAMGRSGTNGYDFAGDPIGDFVTNKCAMIITVSGAPFNDSRFNAMRENISWVPMPKMDKNSPYHLELHFEPGIAIVTGAKNTEAAALAKEFRRWLYLGSPISDYLKPANNSARKQFKLVVATTYDKLTADEVAWTQEILGKYDYSYGDTRWGSWINTTGHWSQWPGLAEVTTEGKAWSAVVEAEYPKMNAYLKTLVR